MAHHRGWARCFGHGASPFDQPSLSASRAAVTRRRARVKPVAHLLGAEAVHLEYPNQGRLRVGDASGSATATASASWDATATASPACWACSPARCVRTSDGSRSAAACGSAALSQADTLDPHSTVGWTLVGDRPDHEWAGEPRIRDVVDGLVADIAWDATDRHAQRWPAATGAAGRAAGRRLGCHRAGRADQPPRHPGHHLAGRPLASALGRATPADCCW
jgi:hypothetical protein